MDDFNEFDLSDVTRPIPHETLAEVNAKWTHSIVTGTPIQMSDRPTRNMRKPKEIK